MRKRVPQRKQDLEAAAGRHFGTKRAEESIREQRAKHNVAKAWKRKERLNRDRNKTRGVLGIRDAHQLMSAAHQFSRVGAQLANELWTLGPDASLGEHTHKVKVVARIAAKEFRADLKAQLLIPSVASAHLRPLGIDNRDVDGRVWWTGRGGGIGGRQ